VEPLAGGLTPPDPRSLCPLSSTEFAAPRPPPPEKIPGYATVFEYKNLLSFLLPDISMKCCEIRRKEYIISLRVSIFKHLQLKKGEEFDITMVWPENIVWISVVARNLFGVGKTWRMGTSL
jgi:hypothetical protein